MAFNVNKFLDGYKPATQTGGFNVNKFLSEKYPTTQRRGKGKLDDSNELYRLAVNKGYQGDADRILKAQTGEETKKIFSGGFISDIFDTLNALQYGVTGVLKGKSFVEGVKTRQSFSDQDALGDKGIPGMIGGIALDIAVDPLTYVAPWTIAKKVPGVVKGLKAVKGALFGKKVIKPIKGGADTGKKLTRLYQEQEGGTKAGKYLADKFAWMFGADPIYKRGFEKMQKNIAVGTQAVMKMPKGIQTLTPKVAQQLLKLDETGRVARVANKELAKVLSPEDFNIASKANNSIDKLGNELVDLGVLGKEKYEENLTEYLHNFYTEFTDKNGLFGISKLGVRGTKKRVAGLTPERMKELGQIDNPAYLYMRTQIEMIKDIENAKLFRTTAQHLGSDVAQAGFKQLPKTQRLSFTGGLQAEIATDIGNINKKLKPAFTALKQTFKGDRKVLSEISKAEKTMASVGKMRAEEFTKFFQEGQKLSKTISATKTIRGVGKLPEHLSILGNKAKKFKTVDDLLKSDIGIEVERLFEGGVLERSGFKTIESFFDFVKKPFKLKPEKVGEVALKGNIQKLIKLQSQIEKLGRKSTGLKELDKRSIDDAYRFWEETISKLTTKKEKLVEQLGGVKLGDLSGKYVPENVFKNITEITEPVKNMFGEKVMGNFKFFKVIMNPATHARNMMSNQVLNWWKLGMNPLDPRVIKTNVEAVGEIARKGGKWIDEAKTAGYNVDTFAANELRAILDSPEALQVGGKLGSTWNKVKTKLGDIYQGEENLAKLSAFIFNRRHKGLGIEEAWKAAESATFNYAQVTPFVRKLRTALWGFPFITFTLKATPIVAETALKAPQRISAFGKIKQAIESQSDIEMTDRERASEPQWIKDGFYVKLPMKDKHGRSSYFDLTYIIPFGDLMAGNFFERQVKRETGLPESIPVAAAGKSPLFQFIKEITRNQDFYGDKIWNEGDSTDKQLGDLMRHTTKTYLPPLVGDQIPGGHKSDGTRRQKGIAGATGATAENQQRTLMQEMLRNVGAKIQPIDADIQEMYQEWNKKKALKTFLEEKGELKKYEINYIPK